MLAWQLETLGGLKVPTNDNIEQYLQAFSAKNQPAQDRSFADLCVCAKKVGIPDHQVMVESLDDVENNLRVLAVAYNLQQAFGKAKKKTARDQNRLADSQSFDVAAIQRLVSDAGNQTATDFQWLGYQALSQLVFEKDTKTTQWAAIKKQLKAQHSQLQGDYANALRRQSHTHRWFMMGHLTWSRLMYGLYMKLLNDRRSELESVSAQSVHFGSSSHDRVRGTLASPQPDNEGYRWFNFAPAGEHTRALGEIARGEPALNRAGEVWHGFFESCLEVQRRQYGFWTRLVSLSYALLQGFFAMLTIFFVAIPAVFPALAPTSWVAYAIAVATGLLFVEGCYGICSRLIPDVFAQAKSHWFAMQHRKTPDSLWRQKGPYIVAGIFAICCALFSGLSMQFGALVSQLPSFFHLIGAPASAAQFVVPVALALLVAVGCFELIMFVKSCVDIVRAGGFSKCVSDAFGSVPGRVKVLATIILVLIVAANIAGVGYIVHGSISGMQGQFGLMSGLLGQAQYAAYIATGIMAGVGLLFYFARTSLMWSKDINDALAAESKPMPKGWALFRSTMFHSIRVLGVMAGVTAVFFPGGGPAIALAIVLMAFAAHPPVTTVVSELYYRFWPGAVRPMPPKSQDNTPEVVDQLTSFGEHPDDRFDNTFSIQAAIHEFSASSRDVSSSVRCQTRLAEQKSKGETDPVRDEAKTPRLYPQLEEGAKHEPEVVPPNRARHTYQSLGNHSDVEDESEAASLLKKHAGPDADETNHNNWWTGFGRGS